METRISSKHRWSSWLWRGLNTAEVPGSIPGWCIFLIVYWICSLCSFFWLLYHNKCTGMLHPVSRGFAYLMWYIYSSSKQGRSGASTLGNWNVLRFFVILWVSLSLYWCSTSESYWTVNKSELNFAFVRVVVMESEIIKLILYVEHLILNMRMNHIFD